MSFLSPLLVATLGGKAQVLTFTLDLLYQQGLMIREVVVLHQAPPDPTHRLRQSLAVLDREFSGGRYAGHPCRLTSIALETVAGRPIGELHNAVALDGVATTMRHVLEVAKAEGCMLHVSITGGPRLLAAQMMAILPSVAGLADQAWHLYTPEPLRTAAGEGAILHALPGYDPPLLVGVPFVPWSRVFPSLGRLNEPLTDPLLEPLTPEQLARCAAVWEQASSRHRDVLRLISDGYSRDEVAHTLGVQSDTVRDYLNRIRKDCRPHWPSVPAPLTDSWLRRQFRHYLALERSKSA